MNHYTLQPYKGMWSRYTCPQCLKHKAFSRYINTETEEPLADHVGRCSRENNCGYHFKPSDYFRENPWKKSIDHSPWTIAGKNNYRSSPVNYRQKNNPMLIGDIIKNNNMLQPRNGYGLSSMDHGPKNSYGPSSMDHELQNNYGLSSMDYGLISPDIVNASFNIKAYADNNFVQYLITLFGFDKANELVGRYRIGTSKHWPGAVVFWQIDAAGKVRTGKIMLYNRHTGKRVKEPFNHITWVHVVLRKSESRESQQSPEDKNPAVQRLSDFRTPGLSDYHLQQCLFGEHLLTENPGLPVAIVESEKTAIMASAMLPGFVWLAAGSLNNLNPRICKVLQYRQVLLFPDLMAYDKWKAKAALLQRELPGTTFKVFAALEKFANDDEKRKGLDLGDLVGRG